MRQRLNGRVLVWNCEVVCAGARESACVGGGADQKQRTGMLSGRISSFFPHSLPTAQHILDDIGLKLRPEESKDFVSHVISVGDLDGDNELQKEEFFRFYRKCLITKEKTKHYKEKVPSLILCLSANQCELIHGHVWYLCG